VGVVAAVAVTCAVWGVVSVVKGVMHSSGLDLFAGVLLVGVAAFAGVVGWALAHPVDFGWMWQ
jgi:hypothetical protein